MANHEKVTLRPIGPEDREILWRWSNDPEVRAQSFHSRPITWEEHCRWWDARGIDPHWYAWIGVNASAHPVGVVRFQVQGTRAEIGVNVAAEARGQGIGRLLIVQGCGALCRVLPITAVDAHIKLGNVASLAVFRSAGFQQQAIHPSPSPYAHLVWSSPHAPPAGDAVA